MINLELGIPEINLRILFPRKNKSFKFVYCLKTGRRRVRCTNCEFHIPNLSAAYELRALRTEGRLDLISMHFD